jgi:hypothetical protein
VEQWPFIVWNLSTDFIGRSVRYKFNKDKISVDISSHLADSEIVVEPEPTSQTQVRSLPMGVPQHPLDIKKHANKVSREYDEKKKMTAYF